MILNEKPVKKLILLNLVLLVIPFLFYGISRCLGWLPSEEEWYSKQMNHGPWRWEWKGLLLYLPVLGPLSSFVVSLKYLLRKNIPSFFKMIGLTIILFAVSIVPWITLFWTID